VQLSRIRPALLGVLVVVIGAAVIFGVGALGESPEDRLNAIADDFRGELTMDRVDGALEHLDPSVAPVEIDARGFTRVYGNGALPDLRRDATRALSSFMGTTFRELGRTVTLGDDEESGQVSMQLLSGRGTATVELTCVRDGERWIVRRVAVRR
jgi:hypothetical protein